MPSVMKNSESPAFYQEIDKSQLTPLYKTKPLRHLAAMLYNWLWIALAIYLATIFVNPATYLLAILVIGARMHALAILMHDASHYRFLKNRTWNDRITNLFIMYPFFLTIEKYRDNHLRHHQHLNTEEDPDWVSKFGKSEFTFPKTKLDFIKTVLSYFLLVQGIKDAIWFVRRFNVIEQKEGKGQQNVVWQRGFYGVLIIGLTLVGGWKYFLLFWIIPYFSTFLMFQYIRSVAEHFGELEYDHVLTASRTIQTNALERFFIAPHNVGYHIEHHLFPGVPFYNLPQLHRLLMKGKLYAHKAHLTKGYVKGLLNELG